MLAAAEGGEEGGSDLLSVVSSTSKFRLNSEDCEAGAIFGGTSTEDRASDFECKVGFCCACEKIEVRGSAFGSGLDL